MRRLVQSLGGIAAVACLLGAIWILRPPAKTYFWDRLFDTGHIFVFGLAMVVLLGVVDALLPRLSQMRRYCLSALVAIGLGLGVELVQGVDTQRTAESMDLLNDVIGVLAFACLYAVIDPRLNQQRSGVLKRGRLAGLAVALLLLGLAPFLRVCQQYHTRNRLFPVLIAFDKPWYENLCHASASRFQAVPPPPDWPQETHPHKFLARIDAEASKYPGFVLSEPYPDWRGYRALEIDVYLDDPEPRDYVLRVHDSQHDHTVRDRFNGRVNLRPGFQIARFDLEKVRQGPDNRELVLSEVDGVAFFTVDADRPLTFYLGAMRLVK